MQQAFALVRSALLVALAAMVPTSLNAQAAVKPWEEYSKLIQSRQAVAAYGPDLFGEEVNLSNGALSFSATDIAVPGNNALEVALRRTYSVSDKREHQFLQPFADWILDTPRIEGTFAPAWKNQRCSVTTIAAASPDRFFLGLTVVQPEMFWHGYQAQMPGGGELLLIEANTPKPSLGGPYYWTTQSRSAFSCLATIKNGSGEGFLAVTSEGVKYWFDWMGTYPEPPLEATGPSGVIVKMQRNKIALYATRVEDRLGNWVTYTYTNASNAPARLTAINSSDGRSITVGYNASGQIASASNGTQTWSYQYTYPRADKGRLTAVVQPDASQWTIDFASFAAAGIFYEQPREGHAVRSCYDPGTVISGTFVASITHPSGATGEFEVHPVRHGRSNVPLVCFNFTPPPQNTDQDDVAMFPFAYDALTLMRKRVTGPALPAMEWQYRYTSAYSFFLHPSGFGQPLCGQGVDCSPPTCTSDACAGTAVTEVAGPEGRYTRHTFGNSYRYNEGKLLKVETGSISGDLWALGSTTSVLRTDNTAYNLAQSGQPYVSRVGTSPQWRGDNFTSEFILPVASTSTVQDGVTFSATHSGFDAYARPGTTLKSGTATRTDTQTYYDNASLWVLGLPLVSTVAGIQTERTDYNAQGLPWRRYAYAQLQQTLTYNADGTLATFTDGRNFTTSLSSWKRGIPQSISYPDSTNQSAVVNNVGWITSTTDQNGFVTAYGYDGMGRISLLTPPSGDVVAWTPTSVAFARVGAVEFGLPAGHWRRTETRGNYRKLTYYDGLWRPVIEHEFDAADVAGTQRFRGWIHDSTGKITFEGYPLASATGIGSFTTGTTSVYDPLGRPMSVSKSSELGALTTSYAYLNEFQTRITDPRSAQTTTSFQAFDQPDTSRPIVINSPEAVSTSIARDALGKPTSITRAGGGNSVTRRYVYDTHQRLCKQIDPETNATLFDYDANGNPVWSARGMALTNPECDRYWVGAADKTVRAFDAMNRVTLVDYPGTTVDVSTTYTPDGLASVLTAGPHVWRYTYNRLRLPTVERHEYTYQGLLYPLQFDWAYDALGHRSSMRAPNALSVAYAPNALGQPTRAGTMATDASYFPDGALRSFVYGNGAVRTVERNARRLPSRIVDTRSGVTIVDDRFAYDGNGNLTTQDDALNLAGGDRTLAYDGLDRLTSAQIGWAATETFTYDALDNLRTRQAGSQASTYNYDSTWRLTDIAGANAQSFSYDSHGNMTHRAGRAHTFDRANRLVNVSGANAGNYEYDGHGRRTVTWRTDGSGKTDLYTLDGVLRWTGDNRRQGNMVYVHLGSQLVAEHYTPWSGGGAVVEYLHGDLVGSAIARTTGTGAITERERSLSYGQALDGSKREGPGFTGHMEDPGIGLVYMQQRYYDPSIGRFLSVDPVGPLEDPIQHFGRYHYASNNPYRYIDPDGTCTGSHITNENGTCNNTGGFTVQAMSARAPSPTFGEARATTRGEQIRSAAKGYIDDKAALGRGGQKIVHFFTDDAIDGVASLVDGDFREAGESFAMATVGRKIGVLKVLRPAGVPADWIETAAKKLGHVKFVNPANSHDFVRVKPDGTITQVRNGRAFDAKGNKVDTDSPAAHGITYDTFIFRE